MTGGQVTAVAIVFFATIGSSLVIVAKALARRIGAGALEVEALREDINALHAEHEEMRARLAQVDELQSRLDFAERVLAQKDKNALPPGGRS
jgi:hypothetical protein